MQVRKSIGPFAAPKAVFVVDDLPKTRSGKIMRRILRKILSGEEDSLGDTSTVSTISQQDNTCNRILRTIANEIFSHSFPTPVSWTRSSKPSTLPARSKVKVYEYDDNDVGEQNFW
jgi:hypothetical protein